MTKTEIRRACKFNDKTVLKVLSEEEVVDFISSMESREEQDKFFDDKEITIKPLSDKEIKDLAIELLENNFDTSELIGKSTSEKLETIRNNKELIADYIESKNYSERLFLDNASTSKEQKWSSSNAWKEIKKDPSYVDSLPT